MGQTSSIQIVQSTDSEDQIIHYFTSQNNIDFISCDQEGKNVLHWAASSGKSLVCEYLIDKCRLDVNSVDQYGSTPLHSAVYNNCLRAARILLDKGANINAQDNAGMTPLHWAVKNTSRECALLLLSYNADKTLKNAKGETPISMTNSIKKKQIRSEFIDLLSKSPDKMMISYELDSYLGTTYTAKSMNLIGICKLWGLIKYTHPYISYRNIDWDQALIDSIPKLLNPSISNSELVEVIVTMVSKIKDFNTRVFYNQRPIYLSHFTKKETKETNNDENIDQINEENVDSNVQTQPYIETLRNNVAYISLNDQKQFESFSKLKELVSLFEKVRSNSDGIIFDVTQRSSYFGKGIHNLGSMFQEAFRVFLKEPLILPTIRQRVCNGLPEHQKAHPSIASIFSQGFLTSDADVIYPLPSPWDKDLPSISFIVDKHTPQSIIDIAISLQSFNKGSIVYIVDEYDYEQLGSGPASMVVIEPCISTTLFSFPTKNIDLKIYIRQNERVNPDSTIGFHPDIVVPKKNIIDKSQDPKEIALKLCIGEESKAPKTLAHHQYAVRKYDEDLSPNILPSVELRLLSLFSLWNAVNYFYPYKDLMDNPWEYELLNFIPIFERASSLLEYTKAVSELVSKLSDTHAYVRSSCISSYIGTHVPPLKVKSINGNTIITDVLESDDKSIRQFNVGDKIISVDGIPIEEKRNELKRLFSSSTPQASLWRTDMKILAGPENSVAKIEIEKVVSRRVNKDSSNTSKDDDNSIQLVVEIRRSIVSHVQVLRNDLPTYTILSSTDYKGNKISYIDLTRLYVHEVDTALDEIITDSTTSLIIDLRGYTRGTIYRLAPKLSSRQINIAITEMPLLLPSLLSDDQNYQSSLVRSYQSSLFSKQPSDLITSRRIPLRIVGLINEETISHGEYSIAYLKCIKPDTVLIGKPTNGAVGNVTNVALHGSIIVGFTGMGIAQSNGAQIQRKGIQPDILVEETVDGIRDGVDEIFEQALKFLLKNP